MQAVSPPEWAGCEGRLPHIHRVPCSERSFNWKQVRVEVEEDNEELGLCVTVFVK